jgi:hypothetical protein
MDLVAADAGDGGGGGAGGAAEAPVVGSAADRGRVGPSGDLYEQVGGVSGGCSRDDGPVLASTVTYLLAVVAVIHGALVLAEPIRVE